MNPLFILLLLHLATGGFGQQQPQQKPQGGQGTGMGTSPMPGSAIQNMQGPAGMGQGQHGASGPFGGLVALLNGAGSLPHQQPGFTPTGTPHGPRM